jgi:hypothetical protein
MTTLQEFYKTKYSYEGVYILPKVKLKRNVWQMVIDKYTTSVSLMVLQRGNIGHYGVAGNL